MKCSVCGTESKGDARFCSGCGATLIVPTYDKTMLLDVRAFRAAQAGEIPVVPPVVPAARPVPRPAASAAAPPRQSNNVGFALVVIALGVVAYVFFQLVTGLGPISTLLAPGTPQTPPAIGRVAPVPPPAALAPETSKPVPPPSSNVAPKALPAVTTPPLDPPKATRAGPPASVAAPVPVRPDSGK